MKQRVLIFGAIALIVAVLAALNAASYLQKEKLPDNEMMPNRSTYNTGSTGTQAFYALLAETGRKVVRWQESPEELVTSKNRPTTFVMIGRLRREITDIESTKLLEWVSSGGRLVIIDREPTSDLITTTANWKISLSGAPVTDILAADPSDQKQMTTGIEAAKPVQPTLFTRSVNAVQASRFSSWVGFERFQDSETKIIARAASSPPLLAPTPIESDSVEGDKADTPMFNAPVVHLASGDKNIVVDVPFGAGSIVYVADPFIVSNGGINLVDNAQIAVNIVTADGGTIAFDEYHQGYGANNNKFFQYFEGTPVIAIFAQAAILIGLIFYSQSRRFARAVPEREPDRLSKLEYVSAMAELQQRIRAYDLAMENIYGDFRRRTSRVLGIDNLTTTKKEMARLIAERIRGDANQIEEAMYRCEDIIHGDTADRREVVELTGFLRETEEKLGMKRSGKTKI